MTTSRTAFWWDRAGRPDVGDLRAVVFSLDAVLADPRRDDAEFADLVWDLHCAGIRVAVTTTRSGGEVHRSVRDLLGDGAVELVITGDEVANPKPNPEIYDYALWEFGLSADQVLAVEDSADGLRAALAAGLTTVVVTTERSCDDDFSGAAAVLPGYDGPDPLSVHRCRHLRASWRAGALSA